MISRTNIVLAVLLGIVVLLAAVSGVDYSRPNVEILADSSMKYTPASTSYESSEVFANKMTQQEPIPGTIARGEMPTHFVPLPPSVDPKKVAPKDSVPGKELLNPLSLTALLEQAQSEAERDKAKEIDEAPSATPPGDAAGTPEKPEDTRDTDSSGTGPAADSSTPTVKETKESAETVANRRFQASLSRGNDLYLAFCVCCHGPAGKGDGLVAQRGYPPPPSFSIGTVNEWNDGQLLHILTHGRANMPSFAAEIPQQSRWDVSNYVRSLQTALKLSVADQQADSQQTPDKEATLQSPPSDDPSSDDPSSDDKVQPEAKPAPSKPAAGDDDGTSKSQNTTKPPKD